MTNPDRPDPGAGASAPYDAYVAYQGATRVVEDLLLAGCNLLRINPETKRPLFAKWQSAVPYGPMGGGNRSLVEVPTDLSPGEVLGIIPALCKPKGGVINTGICPIDFDGPKPDFALLAQHGIGWAPSRTQGRYHAYVRLSNPPDGKADIKVPGQGTVELRAGVCQTILWHPHAAAEAILDAPTMRWEAVIALIRSMYRPEQEPEPRKSVPNGEFVKSVGTADVHEAYRRWNPKAIRKGRDGEVAGPCPHCGGKDRFWTAPHRWDCRQCKPGTYKDAYKAILRELKLGGHSYRDGIKAGTYRYMPSNGEVTLDSLEQAFIAAGGRLSVTCDEHGLLKALDALGVDIRQNVRALLAEVKLRGSADWRNLRESEAKLRQVLMRNVTTPVKNGEREKKDGSKAQKFRQVPLTFRNQQWTLVRDAALYMRRVDPFLGWLETVVPVWDGHMRLPRLLIDRLGAPDDEWSRRAGISIFLGCVQRTYAPGIKLDAHPLLIGPTNIGKSTLLPYAFPVWARERWFTDALDLTATVREQMEVLEHVVIAEISELRGGRNLEKEKAFLSRLYDKARKAYKASAPAQPRRVWIVATSNEKPCIPADPSGAMLRRFLTVHCTGSPGPIEPYMDANRLQLWAEALTRYRKGETAKVPHGRVSAMMQHNKRWEVRDETMHSLVAKELDQISATPLTINEIGQMLGLIDEERGIVTLTRATQNRLGDALREHGLRSKPTMVGGVRARRWRLKDA